MSSSGMRAIPPNSPTGSADGSRGESSWPATRSPFPSRSAKTPDPDAPKNEQAPQAGPVASTIGSGQAGFFGAAFLGAAFLAGAFLAGARVGTLAAVFLTADFDFGECGRVLPWLPR